MRRKNTKVIVTLTKDEVRYLRECIIEFRNKVSRMGGPTEDFDELIIKLCKA